MKTGFEVPNPVPKNKIKKSPWDFSAPPYDERTSCYVNAGTHYGVGKNQPVGHPGNPKVSVPALPQSRYKVNTMEVSEVPYKNLPVEIDQ